MRIQIRRRGASLYSDQRALAHPCSLCTAEKWQTRQDGHRFL